MNVPLIVGVGDGENFLASDVAAVLAHTRRVIFLEEGDVADITADRVTITGIDGRPRERLVHEIDWTIEKAEKGGYPHFMLKEMHEQPEAHPRGDHRPRPRRRIELDELEPLADAIARDRARRVRRLRHGQLRGGGRRLCLPGLAAHAGALERRLRVPLLAAAARREDARRRGDAVRRDGRHASRPTRYAREQGCPIIAITNTVGSAITREADAVLFLQAGPEIAVVATKTFATQVTTLILLAAAMAKLRGRLPRERERRWSPSCARCPTRRQRALDLAEPAKELARRYVNSRGFMFVGRGVTYPVALEGALKLKEVSYVHAEGYAAGELKHGPISLLDAEVPLVAIATRSSVQEKLISNVMEGRARDARVLAVAHRGRRGDARLRRRHPVGARDDRGALPDPGGHPAPAVRLSHGRRARAPTSTSRATSRSR